MFFHDFKQIPNLWVVVRILGYLLKASTVIAFNCTAISRIKIQSQGLKLQASFRTKVNFFILLFFLSFFINIFIGLFHTVYFTILRTGSGLELWALHIACCLALLLHRRTLASSCDFPQQQRHSEDLEICSPLWYSRGNNTSIHPAVLASR